jgi:membrane protein DedA with SNARE-associated domain
MVLEDFFGLTEYLEALITLNLYGGAFLAALFETIFPPIPSEIIMPLAGYLAFLSGQGYSGLLIVAVSATLGATLGAVLIYYVSLKLGRLVILRYGKYVLITEKSLSASEGWFKKYGKKAVFFGRMAPVIRELISIPAGLSRMDFKKFLFYTLIGTFIWTMFLVGIGFFFGIYLERLNLSGVFDKIAVFIIVILVAYILFKLIMKKYQKF